MTYNVKGRNEDSDISKAFKLNVSGTDPEEDKKRWSDVEKDNTKRQDLRKRQAANRKN